MGAKWVNDWDEEIVVQDGLGLDNFAFNPHAPCDAESFARDEDVINNLIPLSENIDVYAGSEESTMRVKDGEVEAMGDVYLISGSKILKI